MKILELKKLIEHSKERKARAVKRRERDPKERWCFAFIGLKLGAPEYSIEDIAIIRAVEEPPGEIELAAALKDKSLMSAVGRYTHSIDHELAIDRESLTEKKVFDFAWWFISALRVRTLADFLVPAASDHAWSTIAGLSNGSCHISLIEDVPRARILGMPVVISAADLDWVGNNLSTFIELLEETQFRLAVNCLTTHPHESSLRMTVASLWAGVEALFGLEVELRFRLSSLMASFLEPRGNARIDRYHAVKTLYDFRSRAVHGGTLNDTLLKQHIRDVRSLLSSLLCKMVEIKRIPKKGEWDEILLS